MRTFPAGIRLILLALLVFLRPTPAAFCADTIAVVTNTSIAPYEEALTAFKSTYKGKVDVLDLHEDPPDKIVASLKKHKYRLITAIGPAALDVAAKLQGPALLTGLILDPSGRLGGVQRDISGVSMTIPPEETLRALRQLVPSVKRVGFVYSPASSAHLAEKAAEAARQLGLTPVMRQSRSVSESVEAYNSLVGKADAIYLFPDTTTLNDIIYQHLLEISFQNSIPLIGFSFKYVKEGALMALSFAPEDVGAQLGTMAMQIISGKSQASEGLQPPSRLRIDINERTAELMKIPIPAALRGSARVYRP